MRPIQWYLSALSQRELRQLVAESRKTLQSYHDGKGVPIKDLRLAAGVLSSLPKQDRPKLRIPKILKPRAGK